MQLQSKVAQPGHIATRTGEGLHETKLVGIPRHRHHDRNRACRLLGSAYRLVTRRDDHIHFLLDQLDGESEEPVSETLRPSPFDCDVDALHVAELAQARRKPSQGGESPTQ